MSRLKCRVAVAQCDEVRKDNDTPAQSQPHRDMGSSNEGSSVRTTEGSEPREADKAGRRLIDSRDSGAWRTNVNRLYIKGMILVCPVHIDSPSPHIAPPGECVSVERK